MSDKTISFYFDESFHSRKINEETINSKEYFDNYVCVGIGFRDIERDIDLIKAFEDKNKTNLSINDESELKSSVVKKKQYKYGVRTFNEKSLELYKSFWELLNKIDIIPYVFISNKLEYILRQVKLDNRNVLYNKEAFIYTVVKAINVYRPVNILSMLLNGDGNLIIGLKKFFEQKINENNSTQIKERENKAYSGVVMILDSINTESTTYKWDYKYVFAGLYALLEEARIEQNKVKIYIDKEGEKENTYAKCIESGFTNVYEVDSKNCIEVRCSDLLCGFIGKMMRAIYEDTKVKEGKYDKKIRLSQEWFAINESQFDLYKLISNVIKDKFCYYWSTCVSIYFDIFLEFIELIGYFGGYSDYTDYKTHDTKEHVEVFEIFLLKKMEERFENFC